MANIYEGTLELIGHTPLVEFKHIEKKFGLEARLLLDVFELYQWCVSDQFQCSFINICHFIILQFTLSDLIPYFHTSLVGIICCYEYTPFPKRCQPLFTILFYTPKKIHDTPYILLRFATIKTPKF